MKIFLHDEIHPDAVSFLKKHAEIIDNWDRIGEADAILVRKIRLDRDIFEKAPNLKVIGFHGSGINGIDLDEAEKHKVEVFAVPGLNADSVAELNVALALDVSHMVSKAVHEIKSGVSMKDGLRRFKGTEISRKTAGIMGMGMVGSRTAKILKESFHMQVMGCSRSLTPSKARELGVIYSPDKESILQKADFIFLALPYSKETEYMIGETEFKMAKKEAVFINTARGKLIDEKALYQALSNHWIKGAACDVFEVEPLETNHPLLQLDNFIATPHVGGNTEEALYRVGMGVAAGILEKLRVILSNVEERPE